MSSPTKYLTSNQDPNDVNMIRGTIIQKILKLSFDMSGNFITNEKKIVTMCKELESILLLWPGSQNDNLWYSVIVIFFKNFQQNKFGSMPIQIPEYQNIFSHVTSVCITIFSKLPVLMDGSNDDTYNVFDTLFNQQIHHEDLLLYLTCMLKAGLNLYENANFIFQFSQLISFEFIHHTMQNFNEIYDKYAIEFTDNKKYALVYHTLYLIKPEIQLKIAEELLYTNAETRDLQNIRNILEQFPRASPIGYTDLDDDNCLTIIVQRISEWGPDDQSLQLFRDLIARQINIFQNMGVDDTKIFIFLKELAMKSEKPEYLNVIASFDTNILYGSVTEHLLDNDDFGLFETNDLGTIVQTFPPIPPAPQTDNLAVLRANIPSILYPLNRPYPLQFPQ